MTRLTDDQIAALDMAARHLQRADREEFYALVSLLLSGQEVGPGNLHRAIAQAQRMFALPKVGMSPMLPGTK